MTNEIHPFEILLPISEALELGILKIGKCGINVTHTNGKQYYLIDILSTNESLCVLQDRHIVYSNTQISIYEKVVRYDEIKSLKFVEQSKLFEDGK